MQVKQLHVTIRELTDGYFNDEEEGVVAYHELVNVRPPYQREFVYKDAQRDAVIRSVLAGFPLSVFYWAVAPGGKYEMLDGQQRTMSICEYVDGSFSVDEMFFFNLPSDKKQAILDYDLIVYVCDGTDTEKLEWFRVINTAGEVLTDQELRNAIYAGSWVSDARRYFSKTNGPAYGLGKDYMTGNPIRQDYLQTVLKWAANAEGKTINAYMGGHADLENAKALWNYYQRVIAWVKKNFSTTYADMKGLPWGDYYNEHKDDDLDPTYIDKKIKMLRADEDVTRNKGVYEYILTGDERVLSIRSFERRDAIAVYEKQGHKCAICGKEFPFEKMQADHIKPWSEGGRTKIENLQMLCRDCNIKKSNK